MISVLPPKAPTGKPPPMILPIAVKSGVTPVLSCTPPIPNLETGHHFVKDQTDPLSVQVLRKPSRYPSSGRMKPQLAG